MINLITRHSWKAGTLLLFFIIIIIVIIILLLLDLRWLITVSSTFQDVDFDGSLLLLFIT